MPEPIPAEAPKSSEEPPVAPPRRAGPGWFVPAALATGAALLLATALQSSLSDSDAAARRVTPAGQHKGAQPDTLRDEAANAIDHKAWSTCIELLDEAKEIDPAGDDMPAV